MSGQKLIHSIAKATGLPEHLVYKEIEKLAFEANKSVEVLSLEDVREILVNYLQEVILKAKKEY